MLAKHGDVIWRGSWEIGFQNFIDPKRFSLRKLDASLKPTNVAIGEGRLTSQLIDVLRRPTCRPVYGASSPSALVIDIRTVGM